MVQPASHAAALAPAHLALRWGLGLSLAGAVAAWVAEGDAMGMAVLLGGVVSVAAGHALAQSMAALLAMVADSPERVVAGQRWALVASVLRYPLLGFALFVAIDKVGLPLGGLLAGVSLWPACLLATCLRAAFTAPPVPSH